MRNTLDQMPQRKPARRGFALCAAALLISATAAGPALAADSARQQQYQRDVAACNSGTTGQDRATCLREAGAVRTESPRPNVQTTPEQRQQNAVRRCQNLPAADRASCEATMKSPDTQVHGSVPGGGVLRERTITVPAPGAAPAAGNPPPVYHAPGTSAPATAPAPMPVPPATGNNPAPTYQTPPPAYQSPPPAYQPSAPPTQGYQTPAPMGTPGAPGTNVR